MTFDITKHKPEELQTRDGRIVLFFKQQKTHADTFTVFFERPGDGRIGLMTVSKNGTSISPDSDIILKPKKPKLLAPAIVLSTDGIRVPQVLFSTIEEATEYCHRYYAKAEKVIWPAIPNKDGYYEIPEDTQ